MDPGTALAVVSLGLQVCQGLLDYYQAWDNFSEDIRETYNVISSLNKTLSLLRNELQAVQTTSPNIGLAARVSECLTGCEEAILRLKKKLGKLQKQAPKGLIERAQSGGLRILYPFRQSTLEKLKETVQELKQDLSLAISGLQLGTINESLNTAGRIEERVTVIQDLTSRINQTTLATQNQSRVTSEGIKALLNDKDAKVLDDILHWLSPPDRSTNHDEARKKYELGTGEWLLRSPEYEAWVSGQSPRLWLHGKAGCCKTILCSTIIEDVLKRIDGHSDSICAYFYFSFADTQKQSYIHLLLCVVAELSRGSIVHPILLQTYEQCKPNKPNVRMLEECLLALLQRSENAYFVIDALDECPENDGQRQNAMKGFQRIAQQKGTRILMTSRRETDIEECVLSWCETRLPINEDSVNADIDIFVKNALATDKNLLRLSSETKKEIEVMFHVKSEGM